MKHLVISLAAALAIATPSTSKSKDPAFVPPDGYVPDAETAEKISEVILVRIFGQTQTDLERPLTAALENGIWIVKERCLLTL